MKQMNYYESDIDLWLDWIYFPKEQELYFNEKEFYQCKKMKNWDLRNTLYYKILKLSDTIDTWLEVIWVSERLKSILEANGVNQEREDIQFLPIRIFDLETKSIEIKWYYLMNILNILEDGLDKWKNDPESVHDYILDWTVINWYDIFKLKSYGSWFYISERIKKALEESDLELKLFFKKHEVESKEEKEFYDRYYKEKWIKVWNLTIWLLYYIDKWEIDARYYYENEPEEMWKLLRYIRDEKDQELMDFIENKFNDEEKERLWIVLRWEEVLRYRWWLRKIEF